MKTKNLTVGILAAVLVLALWWTALLKPTRSKASKIRAEVATQESKLGPLQAQLDRARRDAAHAAEFKAQLQSLQSAMPDSPALAAFIRDANAIAASSGVSWQSVTHGPPTPGTGGVTSITIGIQVRGTYGQVIDYLGQLAALRRLVVVDNLQLSSAGVAGAGAGSADPSGSSTGPFSGASQLAATISARMFESPDAAAASAGTGDSTESAPAAGTSAAASTAKSSTSNNS